MKRNFPYPRNGHAAGESLFDENSNGRTGHATALQADPTAADCNGFRLNKLELLNWGTFDGQVYSIQPRGETTLLVGQNGSGKSTLVDALLTLLVRPGVRNFNVAAGAKKRERTERTYFEGAFDRNCDDDGTGIAIQCLRASKKHYSVLLACFHNAENGKAFTVAQILYWTGQTVEKVYCFSEEERSIVDDFSGLQSTEAIIRTMKDRGFHATKTFTEYERWFSRVTHVKSKAMEVFNQTVAVKDIQRLNDFIRNHMLESGNWSEKVDRLLAHFTQLNEAHQSLLRVRQQSELLDPIAAIGGKYRRRAGELDRAERVMAAVDAYFSQRTIAVFTPELELRRDELQVATTRKETLAVEIQRTQEQCRGIQNEIEQAGGQRLKEIPLLIATERVQAQAKHAANTRYHAALHRAGITGDVANDAEFLAVRKRLPPMRVELQQHISDLEQRRDDVTVERASVRSEMAEQRAELEGLATRRENLPQWCIALRDSLCRDLGLAVKDLPFVAELIAVKPAEREWEASIEKVLHGFALSMLVPERLYQLVSKHVEQTKLCVQGRGRRLVYLRVGESSTATNTAIPDPQSLLHKLDVKQGHPLLPWVKAELTARFNYRCCETIEEFWSCRGLAMTHSRHVKAGATRHDKDDRDHTLDPRNFILGWDNREKKQRIAAEIERLRHGEERLNQDLERLATQLGELRNRAAAAQELDAFGDFSEIAFEHHQAAIDALQQEQQAIEGNSDVIQYLKQRLAEEQSRQTALQRARDDAVGHERELENQIGQAEKLIGNAEADLAQFAADGTLEDYRGCFADLESQFQHSALTVSNFFEQKDAFRQSQEKRVTELRRALDPVKVQLMEAMSRFLRAFPEETDLRQDSDYLDSFLGLRQRILQEDLPRHERRFKERLNEKVTHEIGLFRGELEKERRSIEDKIETLNISLRKLEYRPGTHIQLQPRAVRDPEIVDFKRKLCECVEGSFEDSPEANEARFVRIRDLVQKLHDESNRRWRDKVTDVRRWFDFVADVIDRHSLERVSSYDDSTGQSGGEKAKLAFTILVAAIAYQYDLDPEHPASNRFRFVVVDEMFSKVDDQHAEYALELFRQFGLQLLIVAPLDAKARVTQPYVGCYLHVNKREHRSEVFQMTAQEFDQSLEPSANGKPIPHNTAQFT